MDDLGRQPQTLSRLNTIGGLGALAVQPHLAFAQEFFKPGMRQRRIVPLEPAVQPDAVIVSGNGPKFRHRPRAQARSRQTAPQQKAKPTRRYRISPGCKRDARSACRLPVRMWRKWYSRPICRWSEKRAFPARR